METRVVHPSLKPVLLWYAIAALAVMAGALIYNNSERLQVQPAWVIAIPAVLFLVPIKKHISTRMFRMTIGDARLTLDRGLFSRYSRTIDLVKVQDVTVEQSMWQRMVGMGNVSLETAGEGGQISIAGIDRPREVADIILQRSHPPGGRSVSYPAPPR